MAVVSTGFAQGMINWANANNSKISVNSTVGGPATGLMAAPTTSLYYFALFYSTSSSLIGGSSAAITGVTAATYAFNDSNWNYLNPGTISGYVTGGAIGTNTASGKFSVGPVDPTTGAVITPNVTPAYFVVVGWSSAIGTTVGQLESWYSNPTVTGWIGESAVSAQITPGNPTTTPPGTPSPVFTPAMAFTMGEYVPTPEPSTIALAGLGGLALLAFRRRK